MVRRSVLLALVVLPATAFGQSGDVATPALVRFHTACASCHASECSGRLSFTSGRGSAQGHIQRYAPSAPAAVVRELFDLLARVKRACRVELPLAQVTGLATLTAAQLAGWYEPDSRASFVPLGEVLADAFTVDARLRQDAPGATAQLLDEDLETVSEATFDGGRAVLTARGVRGPLFLLVRDAGPLQSLSLDGAAQRPR